MRDVRTRPFTRADLPAAGRLLAARHRRQAECEPLLGNGFADAEVALKHLQELWQEEPLSGSVAERDGRVVAYLVAGTKPAAVWGPNAWVESSGHALDDDVPVEVARELYAVAAESWVAEGRLAHYVLVPSHDVALADAWWRLGFGLQHVHALRSPWSVEESLAAGSRKSAITVRTPVRADMAALVELDLELPRHQARSPTFSSGPIASYKEAVADWEGDFVGEAYASERFTTFVAEQEGGVVGSAVGCALSVSRMYEGPLQTPDAGFLGFAAVRPEARGLGAGRLLGEAVLAWSAAQGHPAVVTDWRATNLQSSRAWPALGFRPTFWRLHRLIGH